MIFEGTPEFVLCKPPSRERICMCYITQGDIPALKYPTKFGWNRPVNFGDVSNV